MIRNKVVWDKHYYSNKFTVRNIFLLRYSRFRLMCTFNFVFNVPVLMRPFTSDGIRSKSICAFWKGIIKVILILNIYL